MARLILLWRNSRMAGMNGFIEKRILVRSRSKENERIVVTILWNFEEAYKG